jgi:hypothetical protein
MNQVRFKYKILPPQAVKDFLHNLKLYSKGLCKKAFTALRAELCFERHVIFTISRSEIVKMTCLSKEYSAAAGGKRLMSQRPITLLRERLFPYFAKRNKEKDVPLKTFFCRRRRRITYGTAPLWLKV